MGPRVALHCPQQPGVARAVVTHPGVLWQCSTWPQGPRHPLSPPQSCRAAGVPPVQPVCCSSCSTGRHCGMVLVPARGHVVRIMARLRRWPLGNQVSIWPRSGPGFPIPALISGMARYYSYHNNVPVLGSPLCLLWSSSWEDEDGESRTVALGTQLCRGCVWAIPSASRCPHPSGDGHRTLQSWGTGGAITSPAAASSRCPCPGGPDLQTAGAGGRDGQHRVLPELSPRTDPNQKIPHHPKFRKKSFPQQNPWKCLEYLSETFCLPLWGIIQDFCYKKNFPPLHQEYLNKCLNFPPDPSPSEKGHSRFPLGCPHPSGPHPSRGQHGQTWCCRPPRAVQELTPCPES